MALNIVLNGFRALEGGQGGRLRVSVGQAVHQERPACYLRIENDGPPVPEAELEHIFDPFYSGDEQGTGLGLSIAARIVEQHAGYLEAANGGLGVTFTVFLPPLD